MAHLSFLGWDVVLKSISSQVLHLLSTNSIRPLHLITVKSTSNN